MINKKICEPEVSFIMAPFYLVDDDKLMRSQLINLNYQTNKNFEVVIPDPHYKKRSWLNDFVNSLGYNVVHFPYESNLKTPKMFDYGILNDGALMSSSNKIVVFQDWRYVHHNAVEIIKGFGQSWFITFWWQACYRDKVGTNEFSLQVSTQDADAMYEQGIYPAVNCEISYSNSFNYPASWGHYCMDRVLWMQINGIDEVATNTRHAADLDISCRLQEFWRRRNWTPNIPVIKHIMVRLNHNKGGLFGGSSVPLDYEINNKYMSCCFTRTGEMNDKAFANYTVEKIRNGEWIKLYETPYSDHFKKNNTNPELDSKYATIGFQCKNCGVIGEMPHWWDKSPEARASSLIGIGSGEIKLGRNLLAIHYAICNETFENKVKVLRNSWYNQDFLKTTDN
jgi:hypothetical protein